MLGGIFDPRAELQIYEHCRPHWSQAGAVAFVTIRTHDSIPREVIDRWDREKQDWLRIHGYASSEHWSEVVPSLPEKTRVEFQRTFRRCREEYLDTCHGTCPLRQPDLAQIVADALLHFDGERYRMGDFVVMPNHAHLLAAFGTATGMKDQCASWLRFTAHQINQATHRAGKLWQQEPFDHLVRSPDQYDYLRKYIADNPGKARLRPGEYLYRRHAS